MEEQTPALSDEQIQSYVAADAALTTTKPWEFEASSKRMKLYGIILAAITVVLHLFLALVVNLRDNGTTVTAIDQWAYALVGLFFAALFLVAFSRPRIRANADGVDVRNFIGSRFYPWSVIYGLNFEPGARIARLELPEFEYVPVWALTAADGLSTVERIKAFRVLEDRYMPED